MNKYEVTLHTFCDACFSQKTCKASCKRMQTMEKFINKYDNLARAYDKACDKLSLGTDWYTNKTKDEIKEELLSGHE